MSAAHTPTPWGLRQPARVLGCDACGQWYVHAKDATVAAMLSSAQEADARRIVQCVNAHDELVAALEGYLSAVSLMNAAMKDGLNVHGAVAGLIGAEDNARAALVKARGQA